jgi:tetratricopeptide (TPR) repeat protein
LLAALCCCLACSKPEPPSLPTLAEELHESRRVSPTRIGAVGLDGARALIRDGRLEAAQKALEQLAVARPEDAETQVELGDLAVRLGQDDRAETAYLRALEITPKRDALYRSLANVYRDQARYNKAADALTQALALDPGHAHTNLNLGLIYEGQARFPEATDAFATAVRLDSTLADGHHRLGVVQTRLGEFNTALEHLSRALRHDPNHAGAYTQAGQVLLAQGREAEGERALRTGTFYLRQGNEEEGRFLLEIFARLKKVSRELQQTSHLLSLFPDDPALHSRLGAILQELGRPEDAKAEYRLALVAAPGDTKTRNNLANVLLRQGQTKAAIVEYERILELDPEYANAHNNLGTAWGIEGDDARARGAFLRAIELQPKHGEAHQNLGNLYMRQGDEDRARAELEIYRQISAAGDAP